ncbi:hypothetical protein HYR99_10950 [Candidatus Poribacteria bacterium]|nr:hypothetical protein [Candidatus Poribacteria bacterium]
MKELKERLIKELVELLTDEGSPTLRIIVNIFGSFLTLAYYIISYGWIQGLKEKYPKASDSLSLRVIEFTLTVGTTALIIILIGTGIWSLIKQRIPALTRIPALIKKKRKRNESNTNADDPKTSS